MNLFIRCLLKLFQKPSRNKIGENHPGSYVSKDRQTIILLLYVIAKNFIPVKNGYNIVHIAS